MGQLMTTLGIAGIAFTATNIDALLVLIGFFSNPRFTPAQIVAGQYLGMSALIAVSVAGSLLSLVLPRAYIGLFGLLPLGIGLRQLRRPPAPCEAGSTGSVKASNVIAVTGVTVANGGDNVGTYAPLFSTMGANELMAAVLVFWVLTALWCVAAYQLVHHRAIGAPVRSYGRRLLPWVLIGLGIYILARADTLRLL